MARRFLRLSALTQWFQSLIAPPRTIRQVLSDVEDGRTAAQTAPVLATLPTVHPPGRAAGAARDDDRPGGGRA